MSLVKGFEKDQMNAVDRLISTVTGKITDRVPIFPLIDSIPSELLNISIQDYYSQSDNIIKGQKLLQELLNLDYVSNFFYLAIESEIFGMNTLFFEESSPNTGQPIVDSLDFFLDNDIPNINAHPSYMKVLSTTKGLSNLFKGKKPILSVQSGPFSFPSLLMGTSAWFESILVYSEKVKSVLDYSIKFVKEWAIGQIEAGADAIVLVDGLATATSIPKDIFEDYVIPCYQILTQDIKAPLVFYSAGGELLPFAELLGKTGAIGVFPSANDDLEAFKSLANGNYALLGNLNNLEFGEWSRNFMEEVISNTIKIGKEYRKFVLATQHMIPHGISIEKIAELLSIALKYAYF